MKILLNLVLFAMLCVSRLAAAGLPFIQDDYSKALREAQQKKRPIFVECWAPW
jgi:hypothetical protein